MSESAPEQESITPWWQGCSCTPELVARAGEMNAYDFLSVRPSCSTNELRTQYRNVAVAFHPDKNPGNKDAEEIFKYAANAYDVVGDEDHRAIYDRYGGCTPVRELSGEWQQGLSDEDRTQENFDSNDYIIKEFRKRYWEKRRAEQKTSQEYQDALRDLELYCRLMTMNVPTFESYPALFDRSSIEVKRREDSGKRITTHIIGANINNSLFGPHPETFHKVSALCGQVLVGAGFYDRKSGKRVPVTDDQFSYYKNHWNEGVRYGMKLINPTTKRPYWNQYVFDSITLEDLQPHEVVRRIFGVIKKPIKLDGGVMGEQEHIYMLGYILLAYSGPLVYVLKEPRDINPEAANRREKFKQTVRDAFSKFKFWS